MPPNKSHVRKYRQRLRQRAFDAIGRECYFCECAADDDTKLHAAHVEPTEVKGPSRGMDRRFRDVIKHPDKYRAMCADCHRKFDALVSKLMKLAAGAAVEVEEPIPF